MDSVVDAATLEKIIDIMVQHNIRINETSTKNDMLKIYSSRTLQQLFNEFSKYKPRNDNETANVKILSIISDAKMNIMNTKIDNVTKQMNNLNDNLTKQMNDLNDKLNVMIDALTVIEITNKK